MKRLIHVFTVLCLSTAAIALFSLPVAAQSTTMGMNLSWDDCGTFGVSNKTFTCDTNTGSRSIFGSFIPPGNVTKVTGEEMVLDFICNDVSLPSWWQFKFAGSCRQTAFSVSDTWPNLCSGNTVPCCADYWFLNGASMNVVQEDTARWGGRTVPRARIKLLGAIAISAAAPVDSTLEYYSFNFTITNVKTVGSPSCAGCDIPVCVVLNSIRLTQPVGTLPVANIDIWNAKTLHSNWVTWQGGGGADCAAVPVKSQTWGQIKTLYR